MTATGPARLRRGAARRHERPEGSGEPQRGAPVNTPAGRPDRDRVEGRPLSPRAFRHFGIEAVLVGAAVRQEGLLRREGVAIWRRLELFFFQAEDGIRDLYVTGVQTCALPI